MQVQERELMLSYTPYTYFVNLTYRRSCRPHSAPAGTGASGLAPPSSVSDVRGGAGVLIGVGGWHGGGGVGGGYGGHARANGTSGPPVGRGYQAKSTAQVCRKCGLVCWGALSGYGVVFCGVLWVVFAGKLRQLFLCRLGMRRDRDDAIGGFSCLAWSWFCGRWCCGNRVLVSCLSCF